MLVKCCTLTGVAHRGACCLFAKQSHQYTHCRKSSSRCTSALLYAERRIKVDKAEARRQGGQAEGAVDDAAQQFEEGADQAADAAQRGLNQFSKSMASGQRHLLLHVARTCIHVYASCHTVSTLSGTNTPCSIRSMTALFMPKEPKLQSCEIAIQ